METEELKRSVIPVLSEAIERVRKSNVEIAPGFDGKYGKVKILREDEIKEAVIKEKKTEQ